MRNVIFVILLASIFSGCICKKKTEKSSANQTKSEQVKPATVDKSFMTIPETIDYSINSASINGDVLSVELKYKGGKGTHNFSLMFNGMYMKSYPLKIKLFIKHEIQNETQENEVSESLKFDLKPIQSPAGEPMIISIHGYTEKLKYEY